MTNVAPSNHAPGALLSHDTSISASLDVTRIVPTGRFLLRTLREAQSYGADVDAQIAELVAAQGREVRRAKYTAREFLYMHSLNRRQKACGRSLARGKTAVEVVVNAGIAHYRGLQSCGSVHTCPVCGPKIRQARSKEIEVGLAVHQALGGGVLFVTVTLRHDQGDRLANLLRFVTGAWSAVVGANGSSRSDVEAWKADKARFGIVGFIRTLEVTHGANGWHPHLHVLVLTESPLSGPAQVELGELLWQRWSSYIARNGRKAPTREHGLVLVDVRSHGDVARYMAKVYDSLHHEMTRGDLKHGGRSGRNPFRILGDLVATGDAGELALWHEYERAIKGKRFLVWSKGLKARLGVGEVDDETLAAEEVGGELLFSITAVQWRSIKRGRGGRGFMCWLLEAVERGGAPAGLQLLHDLPT